MKCSILGCSGEYEERHIVHTVRHQGRLLVVNHVPADVCGVCGDTLFKPDTVRRLEQLVHAPTQPVGTVPLYEYV
jgi:YgiT-type zinc finger domain-containing protein